MSARSDISNAPGLFYWISDVTTRMAIHPMITLALYFTYDIYPKPQVLVDL